MGCIMMHGILNQPLPDDPSELTIIEWLQFRQTARQASEELHSLKAESARQANRIKELGDIIHERGNKIAILNHEIKKRQGASGDIDERRTQAMLAKLVQTLPLKRALDATAAALAERDDLRGPEMQVFQRKVADMTWPLIGVDSDVKRENVKATAQRGWPFGRAS